MQSDHDLDAVIIIEQSPIISTLEPFPVLSQDIREANSHLTIDIKLDNPGAFEPFLSSGWLVSHLEHWFAWGKAVVSSGALLVFNRAPSVRSGGPCWHFRI